MLNLFVIRVPLSYLNAVEAQRYFEISPHNSILVILYKNREDVDMRHLVKIINPSLWSEILHLPYNMDSVEISKAPSRMFLSKVIAGVSRTRLGIKQFKSVTQLKKEVDKIFIGDCNIASMRHIVNSVLPAETILIDEGGKVTDVYKKQKTKMSNQSLFFFNKNALKYWLISLFFNYRIQHLKRVSFFSTWNLKQTPDIPVYQNTYQSLKSDIKFLPKTNEIFFIGTPFLALDCLKKEVYINYLNKIKKHLGSLPVVYIPHRDETPGNIDLVREVTNFEIRNFEMPIEFAICTNGPVPTSVCAFFSSAIFNLHRIFGNDLQIQSFYVDKEDLLWGTEEFETQYSELKAMESDFLKVIDLN